MAKTTPRSLQEAIEAVGNPVDLLWQNAKGNAAGVLPRWDPSVVPPEVSNWRNEQEAWTTTAVLFDQSYHMPELHLSGKDPLKALEPLCVNNLSRVTPGVSRHILCCTPRGDVIGDNILYCLDDHHLVLVSGEPVLNWVQYHLEQAGEVELERDENWANNRTGRRHFYRYEIAGPNAKGLLERLVDETAVEIPYFHVASLSVDGHPVRVLHHNMAGVPGYELSGPWQDREWMKERLLEIGRAFGLRHGGSLAYVSASLESGWIPRPLPGIYSDPALRPYREWLPATSVEGTRSLGGSFYSPRIEDYYVSPWDLSYGHLVKFDHDFIGRAALEERARGPHRRRVTLVWEKSDVLKVVESFLEPGLPALYIEWPVLYHGWRYDQVLNAQGERVGLAVNLTGYSFNERAVLSLATVDEAYSQPGTQLTLVWGEEGEGARSAHALGRHRQMRIRVTVAPSPIGQLARDHRQKVARWSLA